MNPTFDSDGYPSDDTETAIANWPIDDFAGLIAFLKEAWSDYGVIRFKGNTMELVTGGWSGNEQLIAALRKNFFWAARWQSSHRGGLHVFEWKDK